MGPRILILIQVSDPFLQEAQIAAHSVAVVPGQHQSAAGPTRFIPLERGAQLRTPGCGRDESR